jgi:hypothetical protein
MTTGKMSIYKGLKMTKTDDTRALADLGHTAMRATVLEIELASALAELEEKKTLLALYGDLVEAMCDIETRLPDTVIRALTKLHEAHKEALARQSLDADNDTVRAMLAEGE